MKTLSREQADSYRYNGFLFPLPALTPEEIGTCLAGLDRLERELGSPVADADIKWRSHAYAHSPWFNNLIRHPRILDAVEDLINYMPTHVRVNGPVRLRAMLVRGEDTYGHFDLIDPPSAERDAAALAVHLQVSDSYGRNYNEQVRRHEQQFDNTRHG